MYKINNEKLKNVKAYFEFTETEIQIDDSQTIIEFTPQIFVIGTNKNNDELNIKIETVLFEKELKDLEVGKIITLKPYQEGKEKQINESLIEIVFWTNNNFFNAKSINYDKDVSITIQKVGINTFNVKTNIKEIDLTYDVEIELLLNMNDKKMMELMSEIKYGWVDKDNNKYIDDYESFPNKYVLQSPKQIRQNKVGVCWDQVELERYYFTNVLLNFKTYFIYYDETSPTHTFLVYESGNSFYWFEHSWEKYRGTYKFATLKELLLDVRNKFINDELNPNYDDNKLVIYEYTKPEYGISSFEFVKHCQNGKKIEIDSLK